jgi:maleylacetate reductase
MASSVPRRSSSAVRSASDRRRSSASLVRSFRFSIPGLEHPVPMLRRFSTRWLRCSPIVRGFVHEQFSGRVVFGTGASGRLVDEVELLGLYRPMLISSGSQSSTSDLIARRIRGRLAARVRNVTQHVPEDDVKRARAAALDARADGLISVGGGSATGLAKAVALETDLPIIAVPTTFAGSEMTPIWGITAGGSKRTGRDPRAVPRTVIYDPELIVSLPADVTAASGINAIAHGVEAMYARDVSPVLEMLAEQSIRVLAAALPACVERPADISARSRALYGAFLAGMVLAGAGMAIHHTISHVLGGTYGLPHGAINSALLPHVLAFNAPAAPGAAARIAQALGVDDPAAALYDLASAMGAPTSLEAVGLKREHLAAAAARTVENAGWNPKPFDVAAVTSILTAAFEGRRPSNAGDMRTRG